MDMDMEMYNDFKNYGDIYASSSHDELFQLDHHLGQERPTLDQQIDDISMLFGEFREPTVFADEGINFLWADD